MLIFHLDIGTCTSVPAEKHSQVYCKQYMLLKALSHAEWTYHRKQKAEPPDVSLQSSSDSHPGSF